MECFAMLPLTGADCIENKQTDNLLYIYIDMSFLIVFVCILSVQNNRPSNFQIQRQLISAIVENFRDVSQNIPEHLQSIVLMTTNSEFSYV